MVVDNYHGLGEIWVVSSDILNRGGEFSRCGELLDPFAEGGVSNHGFRPAVQRDLGKIGACNSYSFRELRREICQLCGHRPILPAFNRKVGRRMNITASTSTADTGTSQPYASLAAPPHPCLIFRTGRRSCRLDTLREYEYSTFPQSSLQVSGAWNCDDR